MKNVLLVDWPAIRGRCAKRGRSWVQPVRKSPQNRSLWLLAALPIHVPPGMLLHVWQARPPEPSHETAVFRWAERDRVAVLSAASAAGVVAAVLLAAFGMPPLSIHGPPHFVGIMDPFCGMTRGVAAVARGDFAEAWSFNPASPLVVVALLAMLGRGAYGVLSGRWLELRIAHPRLMLAVVLVAMSVLEVNQQLHVDRLR